MTSATYSHGFVTDVETDTVPKGLDTGTIEQISGKKQRAGMDARLPPERLSPLANDERAPSARALLPSHRLPTDLLLLRAKEAAQTQ